MMNSIAVGRKPITVHEKSIVAALQNSMAALLAVQVIRKPNYLPLD